MRLRKPLILTSLLLFVCAIPVAAKDAPRSFSLSTSRTFSPGESIKIQLIARNVPELEFRVYKVRDVEKFFSGLKDVHSFGTSSSSPDEKIDEKTWLERLHDFKADLWWRVRHFFRGQFTDEARDSFREHQAKLGKRSQIVGAAQFAQVPLLNPSQLVARWKLQTPPTLVSEVQQLPIDGLAAGVYLIEATDGTYKAYTVAIVTTIAVVERSDKGQASLYVADRKTGAPVAKADVTLWAGQQLQSSGQTGPEGMATLKLKEAGGEHDPAPENIWILAKSGANAGLVTPWSYGFNDEKSTNSRAYVYTDRPVYRPGHTVHIKGILRTEKEDTLTLPEEKTVKLTITGPDQKVVLDKDLPMSAHGTVAVDVELSKDAALGFYYVTLKGIMGAGSFYVEEYKKPEYQVTVKPAVARILQGNQIQATIEARYFFGEPVANAKVKYVVHTSQHYWWDEDQSDDTSGSEAEIGSDTTDDSEAGWDQTEQQEHDGVLDANGRLAVTLPVAIDGKHNDQDYRIEARVTDAANREVAGHATVLATYGSFRVSVQPTSYVFESGKPIRVKVSAQDDDNKPVQTTVHLKAVLKRWDSGARQWSESQVQTTDSSTGPDGTALVDLQVSGNGSFEVVASAQTPESRTVEGRTWVWIWNGSGELYAPNAQAQIVADKKSYSVGDTAHLILVTGIAESWAVVTVEGDSVQSRQLMHATSASMAFDVPITQKGQPNLIVDAVLVHDNQVITAQKSLKVPLVERTLTITVTPDKAKYLPEQKGSFDVYAADSQGKPVEADLSFGTVDEALYSVRPDSNGDMLSSFYPMRNVFLNPQTSFEFYFSGEAGTKSPLLASLALGAGMYHPRLAQVKPGSDLVVPKIRKAFPDTAYWNPNVRTGADGHARVQFDFPDALTTWRTTIRAITDDSKAGSSVTRVLVRKNLIVRVAAPRFFRQGDETVLRVIAHNYLETAKEVTFALDVSGVDVIGGQSQKITIQPKSEGFVDWRVKARTIGNAVLTAKALTNEESDALVQTLPILPYGVKQRSASAGVMFSGAGQNQWSYRYPDGTDPSAHQLTITVAPSVAGTVFSALDYLTSYPWGCTEQTMSSFLPDLVVTRAIDKLHLKSPIDRKELNEMVNAGIERLDNFQHDDGGWGWWPDDPSRVFMTAYVVSGLGEAKAAGLASKTSSTTGARGSSPRSPHIRHDA